MGWAQNRPTEQKSQKLHGDSHLVLDNITPDTGGFMISGSYGTWKASPFTRITHGNPLKSLSWPPQEEINYVVHKPNEDPDSQNLLGKHGKHQGIAYGS